MFKWFIDEEGDLTIRIFGFIYLTKYKEHTIVRFSEKGFSDAPKHAKG